ncbi:MAG TPA: MFS transporter, partial [Actinomycetota bacterium]|nr:MFS transporter [Actinomycetota bacterium]
MAADRSRWRWRDLPSSVGILAPLRHRGFRTLWSGLVVSLAGDGIFLVAVAWTAYALADRVSALAWVGLATALPQLALLPFGGALSDRLPRRRVLLAADTVRGAAVGLLALAAASGALRLWELWAVGAVLGAGTAFAAPAFDAIVPDLVHEADLQQANGLDQFLRPGMLRLIGPALGGLIVGFGGPTWAFLADAATFAVSAWFVARLPADRRAAAAGVSAEAGPGGSTVLADLREGLRYVRGEVWLWGTFVAATFTYLLFLGPTEVLIPYLVRNRLHSGAGALGLVLALGGLGSLLAAAAVGQARAVGRPVTFMYAAWTGATLLVVGYGLAR